MFNKPLHYTQLKKEDFTTFSDKSYPDFRTIYKIKTPEKKPYLIYLEEYGEVYFFIKFFPSKHISNPNKFKLRTGENAKILPSRILATCLAIMVENIKRNPNVCFGVYGQWDEKDVVNQSKESQRYRIWLRIATSKIDGGKFKFLYDSNFNSFLIVPKHIYSIDFKKQTQNYFRERFKSTLNELPIPSIEDYKTIQFR